MAPRSVFFVGYMLSEVRRRKGRTLLTALGLATGVGLVVAVSALSAGLDRAQQEVLQPLTGVGTDMSVTRPIDLGSGSGRGRFGPQLSDEERKALERENGTARIGLRHLGEPGEKFSRDTFLAASQLSFPSSEVANVAALDGVQAAAGSLTLAALHIEGTVPEEVDRGPGFAAPAPGAGAPENIDAGSITVTGIDRKQPALAPVTPGQITAGEYLSYTDAREAVLNVSHARREHLGVGDDIELAGHTFRVVGLAETPLGGQASDVHVKLAQLQKLSGRTGRVNAIQVRATSSDVVDDVARRIEAGFDGASVTTAEDLAERVSGSLVDAQNLAGKLGGALQVVGLLAAFAIASLLTLTSVTKRVRELGTLKALGWRQRLVVRQVTAESLAQGVLGAALGIVVAIGAAALVGAFAPSLEATVAEAAPQAGPGPRLFAAFGQGAVTSGSATVDLDAPVSAGLIALAVALALLGGLVAGAAGGLRAARLRPADALRHID